MQADHSDSLKIADRLKFHTSQLHKLAAQVGAAKQIREYDGDRRKALLAKYVAKHLVNGESASASDALARSNPAYVTELDALAEQYGASETVIAEWTATQASFEAARSLLSFEKSMGRDL